MTGTWETFVNLVADLGQLLGALIYFILNWALVIVWVAWWLWGVNWKRAWGVLAEGSWVPLALLMVVGALVWSMIQPTPGSFLGLTLIPNFWWQLGDVCLLVGVALFCGWLQGVLGWNPAEIDLEPPLPAAAEHGHH